MYLNTKKSDFNHYNKRENKRRERKFNQDFEAPRNSRKIHKPQLEPGECIPKIKNAPTRGLDSNLLLCKSKSYNYKVVNLDDL